MMEPLEGVTDTRERKSLGSQADRETGKSGFVSRRSRDVGCAKKRKNIAFGQHDILGILQKSKKTTVIEITIYLAAACVLGCFWSPAILSS
jgi:hypothetical protein